MPGMPELIIIFAVVILLFGANRLPQLGKAVGQSIKNFKKGIETEDESGDSKQYLKSKDQA